MHIKNIIAAKLFLILSTSKVDQQVRIMETVFCYWKRNTIDLSKCCVQAYDKASAMTSEASGAVSKIKKEQPLAEYTDYWNHITNVQISL